MTTPAYVPATAVPTKLALLPEPLMLRPEPLSPVEFHDAEVHPVQVKAVETDCVAVYVGVLVGLIVFPPQAIVPSAPPAPVLPVAPPITQEIVSLFVSVIVKPLVVSAESPIAIIGPAELKQLHKG
jgi:hypothetical protein